MVGDFLKKINKNKIKKTIINTISYVKILLLFVLLWVVFSGSKDPFLIVCGVISIIASFCICLYFNIISPNSYIVRIGFIKYAVLLLTDIVKSTIKIVRIVYSDKLKIDPGIVSVDTEKMTNQEKVLFSNLITMTPGTFVIAVEGNNFLIHALNRETLNFNNNKEISNLLHKIGKNTTENK